MVATGHGVRVGRGSEVETQFSTIHAGNAGVLAYRASLLRQSEANDAVGFICQVFLE